MARAAVRQFLVDYGQFRRLQFGMVETIDLAMTRVRVRRADAELARRERAGIVTRSNLRVVK